MSWIDTTEYDLNDLCSICFDNYGTNQGIFKLECGHIFHNNCINQYGNYMNGQIKCPNCRCDVEEYVCHAVFAFKEKLIGGDYPLFDGNQYILNIYESQETEPINYYNSSDEYELNNDYETNIENELEIINQEDNS